MPIALIDLDGTLADFDGEMARRMALLSSPGEPDYDTDYNDVPPHIEAVVILSSTPQGSGRA